MWKQNEVVKLLKGTRTEYDVMEKVRWRAKRRGLEREKEVEGE